MLQKDLKTKKCTRPVAIAQQHEYGKRQKPAHYSGTKPHPALLYLVRALQTLLSKCGFDFDSWRRNFLVLHRTGIIFNKEKWWCKCIGRTVRRANRRDFSQHEVSTLKSAKNFYLGKEVFLLFNEGQVPILCRQRAATVWFLYNKEPPLKSQQNEIASLHERSLKYQRRHWSLQVWWRKGGSGRGRKIWKRP